MECHNWRHGVDSVNKGADPVIEAAFEDGDMVVEALVKNTVTEPHCDLDLTMCQHQQ